MVELMSNENKKKKFGLKIFSSKSGKVIKCDFHEKRILTWIVQEGPAVAAKQLESLEKRLKPQSFILFHLKTI